VFEGLEATSTALVDGLRGLAAEAGLPFMSEAAGGLFGLRFHPGPVRDYGDVCKSEEERYRGFFHALLDQGVYLAPSGFEAAFVTTAHGASEVEETLEAARRAFKKVG
jgi:glutamate-1-semialdehyde 2,1-aminomutase